MGAADIIITPGKGFPHVDDIRPLSDLFARVADWLDHLTSGNIFAVGQVCDKVSWRLLQHLLFDKCRIGCLQIPSRDLHLSLMMHAL